MEIQITGRHQKVTGAMRDYAHQKARKLERFDDHINRLDITLTVENERHIAELVGHASRGTQIVGKEESADMYASIDVLMDKIERQLKKNKDKLQGHRNERTSTITSLPDAKPTPEEESYEDIIEKTDFGKS